MSLNIPLIRSSFDVAKSIAPQVADTFYEFLFADYPAVIPMFEGVAMEKQKKALLGSLVFIVDHLEDGEKLTNYLKSMGARHLDYGTEEAHYDAVGNTLLKTFRTLFGENWNDELENCWADAYNVIAGIMVEGAREATPEIEDLSDAAKQVAAKMVMEALEESIDGELKEMMRVRVRRLLLQLIKEEEKKLLKKAA